MEALETGSPSGFTAEGLMIYAAQRGTVEDQFNVIAWPTAGDKAARDEQLQQLAATNPSHQEFYAELYAAGGRQAIHDYIEQNVGDQFGRAHHGREQ